MCKYTSFRGDQEMGIFACSLWSNLRWIEHQELLLVCCHAWAVNAIPAGPQSQAYQK